MFTLRNISAFLLLAAPSLAAPYKQVAVAERAVSQGGGYVSNGILYLTTTIVVTVTAGEEPSPAAALTPAASTPALAASTSPVASAAPVAASAPAPAAQAPPSMQHTTMTKSASPAPATSVAPTSQAAPALAPAVSSTQALAAASPASSSSSSSASGSTLDAAMLLEVMPNSASCASGNSECRTADQAVPFLTTAFAKWGINSKAAQAANIALIALESVQMEFDTAQTPPTPGKGTRNMMSPTFVLQYATALYPDKVASAGGDPVKILALVNDDTDSFASASWFLATVCPNVLKQFATDPAGAWTAYLGPGCISTTDTAQRDDYWTKAKAALGV